MSPVQVVSGRRVRRHPATSLALGCGMLVLSCLLSATCAGFAILLSESFKMGGAGKPPWHYYFSQYATREFAPGTRQLATRIEVTAQGIRTRTVRAPAPQSQQIYFVPLGETPDLPLDQIASQLRDRYGVSIEILPPVPVHPSLIDKDGQVAAEDMMDLIVAAHPQLVSDPGARLIGITAIDMYSVLQPFWNFTFSAGKVTSQSFGGDARLIEWIAVVSSARMDPRFFGQPANPDLLMTRLRKMLTKRIGVMYFHLPESRDPQSVMYRGIGEARHLDWMGEELPIGLPDPPRQ